VREVVEIRSVGGAQGRVGVGVALRVYLCGEMVAAAAAAAVPADLEVVARGAAVSIGSGGGQRPRWIRQRRHRWRR
jgi:hypothetical protein